MCITHAGEGIVFATGFVGGENATEGYDDEPMFLIWGGTAFLMKLAYDADDPVKPLEVIFERKLTPPPGAGFEASQGMRLLHDDASGTIAISIASSDRPSNFQFGLAQTDLDGSINWMHIYPAQHNSSLNGHASHPYALAAAPDGSGYVIGGLAVLWDASPDRVHARTPRQDGCAVRLAHMGPTLHIATKTH